jgi:cell division transport system permease protein
MRATYFFTETYTNLKRNILMMVAAVSTVAISLLLLGGVQILGIIVSNVTLSWESKVEVSVYLHDSATPNEIETLEQDISQYPEVQRIHFVSKSDAFEEFKKIYRNQPEFYESLPPDALPASLRVKLIDAEDAEEVAARIEGAPGVEDVDWGGDIIRRLLSVNSLLRTVTLVMSVILMIAAAGLIANTIRLAIYARREEISIMKLVGATNMFIRIPFMIEGLIAALLGSIIAGAMVVAADTLLFGRVGEEFAFMRQVFTFSTGEIVGVLVVLMIVGSGVGLIGSALALRRFLDPA